MKIAIVHDWLITYAGAERVLEQMLSLYPDADLFSLMDFLPEDKRGFLGGRQVHTSFMQRLPFARGKYRNYLALMPAAIERFDLSGYDLVISSSHAVAKGVVTRPGQKHICYCYTPVRYAWDLSDQYLQTSGLDKGIKGFLARAVLDYIREWDRRTVVGVDHFMAISRYIAERIGRIYGMVSTVVYPPVDTDAFTICDRKDDFYLTASRMVPYKRVDLIVEAFSKMPDKRLVVIGDGPDFRKVGSRAAGNIELLGYQSYEVLKDYMQRARAFVFAAEEDFGIAPVEAQACGTPVIAYGRGGALESVRDGETGVFFGTQTPESIISAVGEFEKAEPSMDYRAVRENALRFNPGRFREEFASFVDEKIKEDSGRPSGRKVLLLSTRSLHGRLAGSKAVLKTMVESIRSHGNEITFVCLLGKAERKGPNFGSGVRTVYLDLPRLPRVMWNVIYHFLGGKLSLNECLFYSRKNLKEVRRIADRVGAEVVVTHMIRVSPYAVGLGLPWILALEDILSKRYSGMVMDGTPADTILGYYGNNLPGPLRSMVSKASRLFLGRESRAVGTREKTLARLADLVCLVASDEADELGRMTDRKVFSMPMAVEIPGELRANVTKRPLSAVFVGGLDYQPNLDAVRYYAGSILPEVRRLGLGSVPLNVIGFSSGRARFDPSGVVLHGYVDDIYDELSKHQLFIAPIVSGTGIKTKVLEAMACGLPVLSTPEGVKGLDIVSGVHCYIADGPGEFARTLEHIMQNPGEAESIGLAGRRFVMTNFSKETLYGKWDEFLRAVL